MATENQDGIPLTDDLRADMQCPVCLTLPRNTPIYQCKAGHIHCKDCHPKLKICPECRETLEIDNRSLMTEKILSR